MVRNRTQPDTRKSRQILRDLAEIPVYLDIGTHNGAECRPLIARDSRACCLAVANIGTFPESGP